MSLIRCCGCETIHESTLVVCPGCGRCPSCGKPRISRQELKSMANCPDCETPYCSGCGRCHSCGEIRFRDIEVHGCGFPEDEQKVRTVEETFGLGKRGTGCLGVLCLMGTLFLSGLLGFEFLQGID